MTVWKDTGGCWKFSQGDPAILVEQNDLNDKADIIKEEVEKTLLPARDSGLDHAAAGKSIFPIRGVRIERQPMDSVNQGFFDYRRLAIILSSILLHRFL